MTWGGDGMTRADALAELARMVASLDMTDPEAAAARLLERVSFRADSLELRAALAEEGARSLLRGAADA